MTKKTHQQRCVDLLHFAKPARVFGNRTQAHREIARRFDKDFFDGSRDTGYGGYVYDGRWVGVAQRLKAFYAMPYLARVLDIGCAKGFLVYDLVGENVDAFGMDVSAYAIANAHGDIGNRLREADAYKILAEFRQYHLIVSINTLHNLDRAELADVLNHMCKISEHQYITVDAYTNDEERQRMEAWNLTAKTIMHVDEWRKFFDKVGYHGDYYWFIP